MRLIAIIVALAACAWALDRVLVWCELRGWITYRLSPRPIRSSVGNALLSLDAFFHPSRQHVLEQRQEQEVHREEGESGDRPDAGVGRSGSAGGV